MGLWGSTAAFVRQPSTQAGLALLVSLISSVSKGSEQVPVSCLSECSKLAQSLQKSSLAGCSAPVCPTTCDSVGDRAHYDVLEGVVGGTVVPAVLVVLALVRCRLQPAAETAPAPPPVPVPVPERWSGGKSKEVESTGGAPQHLAVGPDFW